MPSAHRLNDVNDAGAAITSIAQGTVYINNLLASIDGSSVAGHGVGEHSGPNTANGSSTVFIGSIPVNRQGDADTCGHGRAAGSPNVFYNDGRLGAASSASGNATGSSTPPDLTVLPPNISNTAVVAANAAVISAILKSAFISPPAAGLPFDKPEGLKSITLPATASASAAFQDKIIQTILNSGVIPAPPPQGLPFGGDDASFVPAVVAAQSARMFASSAIDTTGPVLSNVAKVAVEAWYRQKIIDVVPEIKEEILPFNNDLNLSDESASISNIVEVPGTNLLSPKLEATGQAWYTLKIIEAMTKDGELPEEKILPFGGDDA